MTTKELVQQEIEKMPDSYVEEVLDFVHFLQEKQIRENMYSAIASESSLKKDWLLPEEEEAWQNL